VTINQDAEMDNLHRDVCLERESVNLDHLKDKRIISSKGELVNGK
jgi:hypothetical protein